MALPLTQNKWVIMGQKKGYDELNFAEGPVPTVGDYGVLVKLHAAALNYRDHLIPKVRRLIFNPSHQSGPMTRAVWHNGSIGGSFDGTWQQYGVNEETWLVRLASNLSYLEGASLSACGVTAWNALYGLKALKPGYLFAIQSAKAGGAKVVATTSSVDKFELLKGLGVDHIINYSEDENWGITARSFTPNEEGFDHILDVGGPDTLSRSVQAIKHEGIVTVIGVLTGLEPGKASILDALLNICTFRGIYIGSKDQMEDIMAAIEANRIQPVLDKRVFKLEELREGLEYMEARKHIGKVMIRIS
ncbi:NAD(P)-binding protein [Trichoderma barbatum]